MFAYDATQPLGYIDRGRVNRAGYPIAVHDVSFEAGSDRVDGFLVLPPGRGPFPGVVYLHGAGGNRTDFLAPASWLVARRAVALVISVPSDTATQPRGLSVIGELQWQEHVQARDVVAVRRALDVLQKLPVVDRGRIGFVGWSSGARTGALVAGVEHRPRAFVLMSGGASPISVYAGQAPVRLRPSFISILTRVDPLRLLGKASRGTVLLQAGRRDEVVPHAALVKLAEAAPAGTPVYWYDAGHSLSAKAYRDQLAWLTGKLEIAGPRVKGVQTGP